MIGLNLANLFVSVLLSMSLTCVAIWFLMKKWGVPLLLAVIEDKYADAKQAISRGMSAMGQKSGEVRQEKALENAVFSDILDEYPEIKLGLEILSPDTAAMIEENPAMAAKLLVRWGPLIKEIIPQITGRAGKNARKRQQWDF